MSWAEAGTSGGLDRWLRELRRAVAWRRRLLAAGLSAGSMAFALQVLAPGPPPGTAVVVATRGLAAGKMLGPGDVQVVQRPVGSLPSGALRSVTQVRGASVTGAVNRGEVLTDVRLAGPSALRGLGGGVVGAPVRLADAQAAALLRAGDVLDVLAAGADEGGQARLVASAVRVVTVLQAAGSAGGDGLGAVPGDGALVLLATTPATASRLAAAAVSERLSFVVRGPG